jgi:hypothetical protein
MSKAVCVWIRSTELQVFFRHRVTLLVYYSCSLQLSRLWKSHVFSGSEINDLNPPFFPPLWKWARLRKMSGSVLKILFFNHFPMQIHVTFSLSPQIIIDKRWDYPLSRCRDKKWIFCGNFFFRQPKIFLLGNTRVQQIRHLFIVNRTI